MVIYKRSIAVTSITVESVSSFEHICVEVNFSKSMKGDIVTFCCVYLPPCAAKCLDSVLNCCTTLDKYARASPFYVLGDFNFPGINWPKLYSARKVETTFLDFCLEAGLVQHVTEATYHTKTSSSLLDLVLANWTGSERIESVEVAEPFCDTCDHNTIIISLFYQGEVGNCFNNQKNFRRGYYEKNQA